MVNEQWFNQGVHRGLVCGVIDAQIRSHSVFSTDFSVFGSESWGCQLSLIAVCERKKKVFRVYLHFTSESFGILNSWAGGSDSVVPSPMKILGFPWSVFPPCHLFRRCRRHGALGIFHVYFFCLTVEFKIPMNLTFQAKRVGKSKGYQYDGGCACLWCCPPAKDPVVEGCA